MMSQARLPSVAALAASVALMFTASACSFFDDDDDVGEVETETTSSETTGESTPPEEGFRVLPQYRLVPVSATVSVEIDGEILPCLSDTEAGGYLCDTTDAVGPTVPITVERDGFETAIRNPELGPSIEDLVVHLAIEGGPEGEWGACVLEGSFETCEEVCADSMLGCLPASCATDDPVRPLASLAVFGGTDCADGNYAAFIAGCEDNIDVGLGAYKCCCTPPP